MSDPREDEATTSMALTAARTARDVGSAPVMQRVARRRRHMGVIAVAAFALYTFYSLTRFRQFLTAGYDLGIFDQIVRAYAHFHEPLVPLKGADYDALGDHFHPILALLAPLYWIYDDPRTLLVAQAALVAASSVFVWRFAARRFPDVAATFLTVAYVIGWPIQGMVDFDFHEIAFALPLLGWAFDALDRRRDRELLVALALLLLVREDMGALVAMIGVVHAVTRRPRRRGLAIAGVGLLAFALVVTVVVPHFARGGYAYWDYPALGSNLGDAAHTVLTHPLDVLRTVFVPAAKSQTLLMLLAPLLMLSIFSPLTLVALQILLERFLSGRESLWTTEFHYNAPVWIIVVFGAVDGLDRLLRRHEDERARRRVPLAVGVLATSFAVSMSMVWPATFPLARLADGQAVGWTSHMADQSRAVASIPPGTCVVVDDRLAPHLTRTNRVTVPGVDGPRADFYVLDFAQPYPTGHALGLTTADVARAVADEGYAPIRSFGQVVVYGAPPTSSAGRECSPTG